MEREDEVIDITPDCIAVPDGKRALFDPEIGAVLLNGYFLTIAAVTGIAFLYQLKEGLHSLSEPDISNFTFKYSNWGDQHNYVGIFTGMFLHGWIEHIGGNLLFFYPLALISHRLYGTVKSLALFVVFWTLAGIGTFYLNGNPSIGASGAVFWVFWMVSTVFFRRRKELSENVRDAAWALWAVESFQIFLGFMNPLVDNVAHVVGFWVGILAGLHLSTRNWDGTKTRENPSF